MTISVNFGGVKIQVLFFIWPNHCHRLSSLTLKQVIILLLVVLGIFAKSSYPPKTVPAAAPLTPPANITLSPPCYHHPPQPPPITASKHTPTGTGNMTPTHACPLALQTCHCPPAATIYMYGTQRADTKPLCNSQCNKT